MEPEQCLLAGTVFLGAIVVTNDSKYEKKMEHKKNSRRWSGQKRVEEKKRLSQVFKEVGIGVSLPWFAATKGASQLRTRRCGPNLAA